MRGPVGLPVRELEAGPKLLNSFTKEVKFDAFYRFAQHFEKAGDGGSIKMAKRSQGKMNLQAADNLDAIKTLDRNSVLHPFTQAADYASGAIEPYVVQSGSGVRIRGADGTELIDGFGGLY